MLDAVKIRVLRDCVTPYGPKVAGDELAMGRRRAAVLVLAGDVEILGEPDDAGSTAETVDPNSLEALPITVSARQALRDAGIPDVPSAAAFKDDDLLALHGVGQATVDAIRAATLEKTPQS